MIEFDKSLVKEPVAIKNGEQFNSYFEILDENKNDLRISLNGKWKVFHSDNLDTNLLEENFDNTDLKEVILPNNLEYLGIEIPQYTNRMYPFEGLENLKIGEVPTNNNVTIFQRDFLIKSANLDYFIEFNGFISCIYLYINGQFVGFSNLNYEVSKFKINDYIKEGTNRISIVLYKYSFATWYNDQDLFRLTGIFRDINLIGINKYHIKDIHNKSILMEDYKTGLFDVDIIVNNIKENLKLSVNLLSNNKSIFHSTYVLNKDFINIKNKINNVDVWSDEEPNLYNLRIQLIDGKKVIEESNIKVGFRRIEIRNGVIYLNNNRLLIKGVNRHEFNCDTGRVITKKQIEEDLKLLKANNFNAVRTSHYPNVPYFYDVCDELGLIVMDEASIETHGTWDLRDSRKKDKDFEYKVLPGSDEKYKKFTLDRVKAMYERDKNHPCIIFWSLGNEAYAGTNLAECYKFLKEKNDQRVVSYEGCSSCLKYSYISDVIARMYTKPKDIIKILKKNKTKPFILIEFAHSMGNSTGNFDEYVNLFNMFGNYQGGFIWDFVDQGLKIDNKIYYGGDNYDYPNDNNFCANGLLLADRSTTSKLTTVKYYYQPFRFQFDNDGVTIFNDNFIKNTAKLKFIYEILENGKVIFTKSFEANILAKSSKRIIINKEISYKDNIDYVERIRAISKVDNSYLKVGDEVAFEQNFIKGDLFKSQYKPQIKGDNKIEIFKSLTHLTVQVDNLKVIFNGNISNIGGLEAIYYDNKQYMMEPIFPTLFRPKIDNDNLINKYFTSFYFSSSFYPFYNPFWGLKVIEETKDYAIVRVKYKMLNAIFFRNFIIDYKITSNKEIIVNAKYKTNKMLPPPDIVGVRIPIRKDFKDFNYIGLGKEDNYIDRYKGIKFGYYNSNVDKEFIPYSIPQDCGNHLGSKFINIPMNGKNLNFYALNNSFEFKYLPYNEFEIEVKNRVEELIGNKFNYLTISSISRGVGGDDSWGAPTHQKYRLKTNKKYNFEFMIKIED